MQSPPLLKVLEAGGFGDIEGSRICCGFGGIRRFRMLFLEGVRAFWFSVFPAFNLSNVSAAGFIPMMMTVAIAGAPSS